LECIPYAGVGGRRAARLWGAAQARRDVIGSQIPPSEYLDYECAVAAARTELGEEAFAAAWAVGRAMTPEQTIAYALEGIDADSVASLRNASSIS
jgi:hypothetical protein